MMDIYRDITGVPELSCSREGKFMYKGKPKAVTFPFVASGRKATARVQITSGGHHHYYQASRLVASAWKPKYSVSDYIVYRDGNIHNIAADNLVLCDKEDYSEYLRRNSRHTADNVEERKRKLQLVADEALMTKRYFETLKMDEINRHVSDYLYPCLVKYCIHSLHMGEGTTQTAVPEAIARMYECIMNGMCLYNYERYLKKLLLNYKKKKSFGFTGKIPKPIQIEVEQLNLECLWERYKVTSKRKV